MIFQYTSNPYRRFMTSCCVVLILFIYNHTSAYATTTNLKSHPDTPIQATKHTSKAITNTYQPCKSIWAVLWGTPAPEPRLTLGMWSAHATKKDRNNKNDMIGVSYYGLGVGTFVNSYYERSYAATIQRYWVMAPLYKEINYEIGYRLGLVTGYKGYNITGVESLKNAPVLPFVQLIAGLNWKYFGWEISSPDPYVISTSFYIRFL